MFVVKIALKCVLKDHVAFVLRLHKTNSVSVHFHGFANVYIIQTHINTHCAQYMYQ